MQKYVQQGEMQAQKAKIRFKSFSATLSLTFRKAWHGADSTILEQMLFESFFGLFFIKKDTLKVL